MLVHCFHGICSTVNSVAPLVGGVSSSYVLAKEVQLGDRAIHSGWLQISLTVVELLCTAYALNEHMHVCNEHLPCKSRK